MIRKKLRYLWIALVSRTSCESNNNNVTNITNNIIGEWQLDSRLEDGKETASICTKKTTFSFGGDSILKQIFYKEEEASCTPEPQKIFSWLSLGNSKYRIESPGGVANTYEFNFTENNTKFSVVNILENETEVVSTFNKK